jgi:hypothetical protein
MIILSIHLFPFEMKRFQRIVNSINLNLKYTRCEELLVHATLNKNSNILEHEYDVDEVFINLMKTINCDVFYEIKNEVNFLGVNEHRRKTIQLSDKDDYIIYIDSDLIFNDRILANQIIAIDYLKNKNDYFIVTPNTIRLWDKTWDIITHEKYLTESFEFHRNANFYDIVNQNYGKIYLEKINKFKWGGGWFNCFSANLLKLIKIPTSFKGYGPDDTFVMECCNILKKEGENVSQYIMKNMIVCEDIKIDSKKYFKKKTKNFRELCNKNFNKELSNFYISYKKEII